jgi:anaerobic magnesium-protoporphyrin IX monomethyl ester cyclase
MPLGVSYLAANLRHDYDVEVLDATAEGYAREEDDVNGFFRFGLSLSAIRRRIESSHPDVVGVGCLYSPVWPVVRDILEVVKSIDRDIVTVVGGNLPTFLARECLEEDHAKNLDFIVLGEGEESSRELFQCLEDGAGFEAVNGLAYTDALGNPVVQPKTHQIEDLDALAFPARDLMPLATYASINIPHTVRSRTPSNSSLFTSRGCPARCTFCSSTNFWAMGKRYRRRSVQNVVAEIEESIQKYGIDEFNIEDDNFTAHVPHAKELLREIIRRKLDITWNAPIDETFSYIERLGLDAAYPLRRVPAAGNPDGAGMLRKGLHPGRLRLHGEHLDPRSHHDRRVHRRRDHPARSQIHVLP